MMQRDHRGVRLGGGTGDDAAAQRGPLRVSRRGGVRTPLPARDRETERQRDSETETETDRQRDRETKTEKRHRETTSLSSVKETTGNAGRTFTCKPRPEFGVDCIICATLARQRLVRGLHGNLCPWVALRLTLLDNI